MGPKERLLLSIYNLIQVVSLPLVAPPLLMYLMARSKYRGQVLRRLGVRQTLPPETVCGHPRIWVHALSVGEINGALPLIHAIKKRWPESAVMISATTATGLTLLKGKMSSCASAVFPAPYDLFPTILKFVKKLRPDCFILVETDVWPNWIWGLNRQGVATMLVNGSISSRAASRLSRLGPLKDLLYKGFRYLGMQSEDDRDRLVRLGIPEKKIVVPGNIKYDIPLPSTDGNEARNFANELGLPVERPIWVCGSTHPGEEEIIVSVFREVKRSVSNLFLILAPRHPERGGQLHDLVTGHGLAVHRRSQGKMGKGDEDVFILDTIGELRKCYGLADVAFVGGSLVNIGGHNLLEPASYKVPVLFGPFVESCREMARDIEKCGGGKMVADQDELATSLKALLETPSWRDEAGKKAYELVKENQGVVSKYISLLEDVLEKRYP